MCLVMLLASTVGCNQEESAAKPEEYENKITVKSNLICKAVKDSPVVVRIEGYDLSKIEVCRRARALLTLMLNKQRKTKLGKREWSFLGSYCQGAADREISHAAIRHYLRENKLAANSNVISSVTHAFERNYGVRSKKLKRWHRVADLKYMLGKHGDQVDREIQGRVNYVTATNAMLKAEPVSVSDQEIDKRLREIADYNITASETNALVFARATNVWQEVIAKTISFEDAAKKYSEDIYIDHGCEWGMFTMDQLQDEPGVLAILPNLSVGDITAPVESDGGLAILRKDESDDPKMVTFSRIFFRLPLYYHEESREEAARNIQVEKERALINNKLKAIIETLKIEYPDGKDLFGIPGKMSGTEFESCWK